MEAAIYIILQAIYVDRLKKSDSKGYFYIFSTLYTLVQSVLYFSGYGSYWGMVSVFFVIVVNLLTCFRDNYRK